MSNHGQARIQHRNGSGNEQHARLGISKWQSTDLQERRWTGPAAQGHTCPACWALPQGPSGEEPGGLEP